MSKEAYEKWFLGGAHALRSASEQGVAAARKAQSLVTNPELRSASSDAAEMLERYQDVFEGFIRELGAEPNDFYDQITDGITRGTEEMLRVASDKTVIDAALINSGQTFMHYYIVGFGSHAAAARALGKPEQAAKIKSMVEECKAFDQRYTAIAETVVNRMAAGSTPA